MKSIETIATVTKDGKITTQLPLDIPEGEHQVVIVIDEKPLAEEAEKKESGTTY
ncbi:MAG: hypothetical protein V7K25_21345 [Nostoc sp.]|uniref:hypothetical protein n=1 Tax=Nostoc sp. TaxID=1180 RepID=UPI002FF898FA